MNLLFFGIMFALTSQSIPVGIMRYFYKTVVTSLILCHIRLLRSYSLRPEYPTSREMVQKTVGKGDLF